MLQNVAIVNSTIYYNRKQFNVTWYYSYYILLVSLAEQNDLKILVNIHPVLIEAGQLISQFAANAENRSIRR